MPVISDAKAPAVLKSLIDVKPVIDTFINDLGSVESKLSICGDAGDPNSLYEILNASEGIIKNFHSKVKIAYDKFIEEFASWKMDHSKTQTETFDRSADLFPDNDATESEKQNGTDVQRDISSNDVQPDNISNDDDKPKVGLLKCVDISKLLDPSRTNSGTISADPIEDPKSNVVKVIRFKNRFKKRTATNAENINSCTSTSKNHNSTRTIKVSSDLEKPRTRSRRIRLRKTNIIKIDVSDSDSNSDSTSYSNPFAYTTKTTKIKQSEANVRPTPDSCDSNDKMVLPDGLDKKFSLECYVSLPKATCAQLIQSFLMSEGSKRSDLSSAGKSVGSGRAKMDLSSSETKCTKKKFAREDLDKVQTVSSSSDDEIHSSIADSINSADISSDEETFQNVTTESDKPESQTEKNCLTDKTIPEALNSSSAESSDAAKKTENSKKDGKKLRKSSDTFNDDKKNAKKGFGSSTESSDAAGIIKKSKRGVKKLRKVLRRSDSSDAKSAKTDSFASSDSNESSTLVNVLKTRSRSVTPNIPDDLADCKSANESSTDNEFNSPNSSTNVEENVIDKDSSNNLSKKEKEDEAISTDKESDKVKKKKSGLYDKLLTSKLYDSDEDESESTKKKTGCDDLDDSDIEILPVTSRKATKRKRVAINSSGSESSDSSDNDKKGKRDKNSSDDSDSDADKKSKKNGRRRIRKVNSSSDSDSAEKVATRKKIRNVLKKGALADTTLEAVKNESERKARILEKQKKYNNLYNFDPDTKAVVEKLVLDFNEETNEELLKVNEELVKKLKPHQAKGIQFMWDACFESLERTKSTSGSGCILAHCMGLGKTLQVIALIHTLLNNREKTGVSTVLVVCPLSTVLNWVAEFKKWLDDLDEDDEVNVFDLVQFKNNSERQYQVKEWSKCGGVLILGYDSFRNLAHPDGKRMTKKLRNVFQAALVDPGPDLIVCDEGHLLKNEKTSISVVINRIKTQRRIILTGTPIQNNLKEYYCMIQFVKPHLLGTYKEYMNRFVNPITNGQYTDSTQFDIQIMRKRSHVLHKMLDGLVQRRDYGVLAPYLPPKHEYVLFLNLTDIQKTLYNVYLTEKSRRVAALEQGNKASFLFVDFQALQRICTHPRVLLDKSLEERNKHSGDNSNSEEESEGSLKDFIDDDESAKSTTSGSSSEASNPPKRQNTRSTRGNPIDDLVQLNPDISDKPKEEEWWETYCKDDILKNLASSSKLSLLFDILTKCEQIGDKLLVFSQSLYSLNIIEYFLERLDEAHQDTDPKSTALLNGLSSSWALGLDYFRIDGSTTCDNRANFCRLFNDEKNLRARLFLISTKAGGLGINLVAANRVVIFDVSWNPSHDLQSIYRIYRFGQKKPCYVYRFVTLGVMEQKIYERQVTKQAISKRVIDEQQIDRHYNQNDLAELYKFEPQDQETRPIPLVPKDVLLGELLQDKYIYKYHEHQSLLENKEDEELNEDERKAAWEEFENEKQNRVMNTGHINHIPMTSITLCLARILKTDRPDLTDIEIQQTIPHLMVQLQMEMTQGDNGMYSRIIQELKLIEMQRFEQQQQFWRAQSQKPFLGMQQQKTTELARQYALWEQQQRIRRAMEMNNTSILSSAFNNIPGRSGQQDENVANNASGVIDITDDI